MAEAKSYSDYQLYTNTDSGNYLSGRLDYIRPPTLEPEDMEINNNYSISGGRLKVDWRPADKDTLLFISYAGFLAIDPYSAGNRWIYNASLGAEQDFLERGLATLRRVLSNYRTSSARLTRACPQVQKLLTTMFPACCTAASIATDRYL